MEHAVADHRVDLRARIPFKFYQRNVRLGSFAPLRSAELDASTPPIVQNPSRRDKGRRSTTPWLPDRQLMLCEKLAVPA